MKPVFSNDIVGAQPSKLATGWEATSFPTTGWEATSYMKRTFAKEDDFEPKCGYTQEVSSLRTVRKQEAEKHPCNLLWRDLSAEGAHTMVSEYICIDRDDCTTGWEATSYMKRTFAKEDDFEAKCGYTQEVCIYLYLEVFVHSFNPHWRSTYIIELLLSVVLV
jgi:hypothetical protein